MYSVSSHFCSLLLVSPSSNLLTNLTMLSPLSLLLSTRILEIVTKMAFLRQASLSSRHSNGFPSHSKYELKYSHDPQDPSRPSVLLILWPQPPALTFFLTLLEPLRHPCSASSASSQLLPQSLCKYFTFALKLLLSNIDMVTSFTSYGSVKYHLITEDCSDDLWNGLSFPTYPSILVHFVAFINPLHKLLNWI